jgi:hypothetical protein
MKEAFCVWHETAMHFKSVTVGNAPFWDVRRAVRRSTTSIEPPHRGRSRAEPDGIACRSESMPALSRVNWPEVVACRVEPVTHGGGWPESRRAGCGQSRAAAHAAKSDARTHRRSRASGMSPYPRRRKRAGGWKSQRDGCRRRGNGVPDRVRRKAACSPRVKGYRSAGASAMTARAVAATEIH